MGSNQPIRRLIYLPRPSLPSVRLPRLLVAAKSKLQAINQRIFWSRSTKVEEITLNKKYFKKGQIGPAGQGNLARVSEVVKYISQLLAFFHVAPVLVITSLWSKATVFTLGNIASAIVTLFSHINDYFAKRKTLRELLIIAVGTVVVAYIIILSMPSISIVYPLDAWLFKINIWAYAINGFDFIKDFIIDIVSRVFQKINKNWNNTDIIDETKLDPNNIKHKYIIHKILRKIYSGYFTPENGEIDEKKFAQLQKLIELINKYTDKKKQFLLGFVANKTSIAQLQKRMDSMLFDHQPKLALEWVADKIDNKILNIGELKKAFVEIDQFITEEHIAEAVPHTCRLHLTLRDLKKQSAITASKNDNDSHCVLFAFNNLLTSTVSVEEKRQRCKLLLTQRVDEQIEKLKEFNEALPPSQQVTVPESLFHTYTIPAAIPAC